MNSTLAPESAPDQLRKSLPAVMKAAVLSAPHQITFEEVPVPKPDATQALVQMEGCGLCASSNPLWEGREWFNYPQPAGAPGHEGWGRVVRAGDASGLDEGQRVATLVGNAFSPYVLVNKEQAVVLPDSLDGVPFPGEPLGCVMNIMDRSRIEAGQTVVIIGIGFIGLLTAKLAAARGARVIAVSRRSTSLEKLDDKVQRLQYNDQWAAIRQVMELTDGKGADRVIECTGHQVPLNMATDMVAEGGMIVIAGYHQDGLRQVDMQKWNWKGIDVINAHERDLRRYVRGIQEAVELVEKQVFDPSDLISHWFTFEELQEAMELTSNSPEGLIKACIRFPK